MFEDITVGLLWWATTWFVANIVLGVMDGLKTTDSELRKQLVKRLDEVIHRVREEQNNDIIYWYDHDDNEFLAQGRTQEEIIEVLKGRFPNHIFYLDSEHVLGRGTWEPKKIDIAEIVKHKL
jgi:hypothetical protein